MELGRRRSLPREGEILDVIDSPSGARYRVSWADGHESDTRPAAGSASITPAPKAKKHPAS